MRSGNITPENYIPQKLNTKSDAIAKPSTIIFLTDDYVPTPSSLIGQLYNRLNIDIRVLAKEKEEDLRSLYSCWWSKPLPDHLSFEKILCFEGG